MKPKYKYNAFIENTPEARMWLECIGYHCDDLEYSNGKFITTFEDGTYLIGNFEHAIFGYDCSGNIPVFKAITAINNENDYMQWFIDNDDDDNFYMNVHEQWKTDLFRKATPEELIEYFKK